MILNISALFLMLCPGGGTWSNFVRDVMPKLNRENGDRSLYQNREHWYCSGRHVPSTQIIHCAAPQGLCQKMKSSLLMTSHFGTLLYCLNCTHPPIPHNKRTLQTWKNSLYSSYSIIRPLVYPDFDYPVRQKCLTTKALFSEYSVFLCTNHSKIKISRRNYHKITLKPQIL